MTSCAAIRVVSSMATKAMLAELIAEYDATAACKVELESVGGVDAAHRVRAGEPFDVVVLARDAIDKLAVAGHLVPHSVTDLATSAVAVAVRRGQLQPEVNTEQALRRAVVSASSIGISTGPSGVELSRLFERWGILDQIRDRIVTASPGIAVGSLVARGEVELGFQQYSELLGLDGIDVLGRLPQSVGVVTTFAAAVTTQSSSLEAANRLTSFLASAEAVGAKRRHGMDPVKSGAAREL